MENNLILVRQHNHMTEARYELSETAINILLMVISKVRKDDDLDKEYIISIAELTSRMGVSKIIHSRFEEACEQLMKSIITVKNINKITFCLLSSTKKAVNRAHFYIVNDQLFEVGRFSDFSSIACLKDKMNEYSNIIYTRKVRILKHNYNACLLIKEGLKYRLVVEDFIDLDNDNAKDRKITDTQSNKFFEFTYDKGVIVQNSVVFNDEQLVNYRQEFLNVYTKRLNYCRSYYPSPQTYATLEKMGMDDTLPLDENTLLLLSMYEI